MAEESTGSIPACPPLPKNLVVTNRKPPPVPRAIKVDRAANDPPAGAGGGGGGGGGGSSGHHSLVVVQYKTSGTLVDNDPELLSVSLEDILKTFNAPISEDQAWALIYQSARMFKAKLLEPGFRLRDLRLPSETKHLNVHKDGSCFVAIGDKDKDTCVASSQKKILLKLGVVVYTALDYNLPANEDCPMSHELEELIEFMTAEDNDDEGIEHDSEEPITDEDEAVVADHVDDNENDVDRHRHRCSGSESSHGGGSEIILRNGPDEDRHHNHHYHQHQHQHHHSSSNDSSKKTSQPETKELDHVLAFCSSRVSPSKPEDHYRAVCRALATETLELRTFLQRVCQGDAEVLRLKAQAETSGKELEKIHFSDWARFWMQVVDELRRGVRLKKINFSRTPIEYELTPYEILMEDIRSRKYNLRKVMVNGDIPPRVKKDAHAVILEFIRSRPPLRKASDRKLAPQPLKRVACPREQLLDSIRKGRVLKPVHPKLKTRPNEANLIEPIRTNHMRLLRSLLAICVKARRFLEELIRDR